MTYFSNSSVAGWLQCRRAQHYQVLIRAYQRQADIWPDSKQCRDSVECRVYMRGHRALNRELKHCSFTDAGSELWSFHTAPLIYPLHSNTRIPGYYLLLTTAEWDVCWYLYICIWLGRCVGRCEETPSEMSSTGPWRRRRWRPISAPHCQPIVAS